MDIFLGFSAFLRTTINEKELLNYMNAWALPFHLVEK